jgi:hypothetical protein
VVIDEDGIAKEVSFPANRSYEPRIPDDVKVIGYWRPRYTKDPKTRKPIYSDIEFDLIRYVDGKPPVKRGKNNKSGATKATIDKPNQALTENDDNKQKRRRAPRTNNNNKMKIPSDSLPPLPIQALPPTPMVEPEPMILKPLPPLEEPASGIISFGTVNQVIYSENRLPNPFDMTRREVPIPQPQAVSRDVPTPQSQVVIKDGPDPRSLQTFPNRGVSSTTTDVHALSADYHVGLVNCEKRALNWSKPLFPRLLPKYTATGNQIGLSPDQTVGYARAESVLIYRMTARFRELPCYHPYSLSFWEQFGKDSAFYDYAQFQIQCINILAPMMEDPVPWNLRNSGFIDRSNYRGGPGRLSPFNLDNAQKVNLDVVLKPLCDVLSLSPELLDIYVDSVLLHAVQNELYLSPVQTPKVIHLASTHFAKKRNHNGEVVAIRNHLGQLEF